MVSPTMTGMDLTETLILLFYPDLSRSKSNALTGLTTANGAHKIGANKGMDYRE